VGRARELDRLTQALTDSTLDTACILITMLGAAGVGKSRLLEEFGRSLLERARVLVGHTPPYGEGGALPPSSRSSPKRPDEAVRAADTLEAEALVLDRAARIIRHLTRSLVAEIRGSFDAAMTEIDGAVALALDPELTMWQTTALEHRARLLRSRDEPDAGVGDLQLALALHRAKQNEMGQRRVTALLA
jgi:hypothetical protein